VDKETDLKDCLIFGAKSIALGVCIALRDDIRILGFMVSSLEGNPCMLDGLPVYELAKFTNKNVCVLIATPEDIQGEIESLLEQNGFYDHIRVDSALESQWMEEYFTRTGEFRSLHALDGGGPVAEAKDLRVYMAQFYRDKALRSSHPTPDWLIPIQVGAALTSERIAAVTDDASENISVKNPNYCELTALYWIWKNAVQEDGYYGLFHYRRWLDLREGAVEKLTANNVDVILPYPTMHEPDIREHHARYIREEDWNAMLAALRELEPEYYEAYGSIFSQKYLYNYNILIAGAQVFRDYCAWLFPILERTEELSVPRGAERRDRYIGYLGENLLTLYFMYHQHDLNIVHTGRVMLV